MATWVSYAKARKFSPIRNAYGEVEFKSAVLTEVAATATWARRKSGAHSSGDLNLEVDVSAVPNVAALTDHGTLV